MAGRLFPGIRFWSHHGDHSLILKDKQKQNKVDGTDDRESYKQRLFKLFPVA